MVVKCIRCDSNIYIYMFNFLPCLAFFLNHSGETRKKYWPSIVLSSTSAVTVSSYVCIVEPRANSIYNQSNTFRSHVFFAGNIHLSLDSYGSTFQWDVYRQQERWYSWHAPSERITTKIWHVASLFVRFINKHNWAHCHVPYPGPRPTKMGQICCAKYEFPKRASVSNNVLGIVKIFLEVYLLRILHIIGYLWPSFVHRQPRRLMQQTGQKT